MQNGFLSALPYLGCWIMSILSGILADFLLERRVFGVTVVRKIFTLTGKKRAFALQWQKMKSALTSENTRWWRVTVFHCPNSGNNIDSHLNEPASEELSDGKRANHLLLTSLWQTDLAEINDVSQDDWLPNKMLADGWRISHSSDTILNVLWCVQVQPITT